jgi:hypothetical protein
VLNANDLEHLRSSRIELELKQEGQEKEVAALRIPLPRDGAEPKFEQLRIDLATGALLDARHDLYPAPHAYVTPYDATVSPVKFRSAAQSDCDAAGDPSVHLASRDLFARARRGPLPEFPVVAHKANIHGSILMELQISESGDVLCIRHTGLPFGLTEAAMTAARQWKFRPYTVDGHPVKFSGELLVHFEDIDAATWAGIARTLPPSE